MAENGSPRAAQKRKSSGGDEDDASSPKRAKAEEDTRDPGKRAYRDMTRVLKGLKLLASKSERDKEEVERLHTQIKKLQTLCAQTVAQGESPNPTKILQFHLKHILLNSEKIQEQDNVKNFLTDLEDSSAGKSDKDESVFVFLANFATELWYRWDDDEEQWKWTPDWEHWMPCSTTVVTGGQWDGETPAPENVEIIGYLDAIRPVPSDEPYLQAVDVIALFEQLLSIKNPTVDECLRAIVGRLAEVKVKTKNEHASEFVRALDELKGELNDSS